jgi:hypothetical protein
MVHTMQTLFCAIFEEWILKIESTKTVSTISKYSAAMKIDPPSLCHNPHDKNNQL